MLSEMLLPSARTVRVPARDVNFTSAERSAGLVALARNPRCCRGGRRPPL